MIIKEMYAKATFINILKHKINWLFKIYQRFIKDLLSFMKKKILKIYFEVIKNESKNYKKRNF